jgi:hypothetical protein
MEPEGSLQCSLELVTSSYLQTDEYNLHTQALFP